MSPRIQNQIILLSFLIATFFIYKTEIESLPSFSSSFEHVTGFAADLFSMCCFLFVIGILIPMLVVLNGIVFSSRYFLIDPRISRRLYFYIVLQYLEMLLPTVCFQVFSVLFFFCEQKLLYFILRLSILGHGHPVSHFLSGSLVFILMLHAFKMILKIGIDVSVAFERKYEPNIILSTIIWKNAHFLIPYAFCLGFYIVILINTVLRLLESGDDNAIWPQSMIIWLITAYSPQY